MLYAFAGHVFGLKRQTAMHLNSYRPMLRRIKEFHIAKMRVKLERVFNRPVHGLCSFLFFSIRYQNN